MLPTLNLTLAPTPPTLHKNHHTRADIDIGEILGSNLSLAEMRFYDGAGSLMTITDFTMEPVRASHRVNETWGANSLLDGDISTLWSEKRYNFGGMWPKDLNIQVTIDMHRPIAFHKFSFVTGDEGKGIYKFVLRCVCVCVCVHA